MSSSHRHKAGDANLQSISIINHTATVRFLDLLTDAGHETDTATVVADVSLLRQMTVAALDTAHP